MIGSKNEEKKKKKKKKKQEVREKRGEKEEREKGIERLRDGDESEKCVRMKDEKKHIEYLSANNVFDQDRISCTFHFHLLPF